MESYDVKGIGCEQMNSFERDGILDLLKEISPYLHSEPQKKKLSAKIKELENMN